MIVRMARSNLMFLLALAVVLGWGVSQLWPDQMGSAVMECFGVPSSSPGEK